MISKLTGFISEVEEKTLTLDVHGVGYEIYLSPGTLAGLLPSDEPITIYTHMHVREQSMELFGFLSKDAKHFFEMVIGVSGIGPKGALGVLDIAPLQTLVGAIMQGDASYLTKVSGVGKRTAEKIVLETKDKVAKLGIEGDMRAVQDDSDALAALQALGYTLMQARDVLREIPDEITATNEKITYALKKLGS
jgi:holliday junction DNA helicase RuvA